MRKQWSCLLLAAFFVFSSHAQEPEPPADPPAPAEATASAPEEEPAVTLDQWLDTLAVAESGNRPHIVHRDRDGQLYYGCLQFKESTFRVYVRKFHLLPKTERSEVMAHIYDCRLQKHLAALMLRDDPNTWKYWRYTVEKRVGFPPVSGGQ